jgi:hypothetical protein
LKILAIILLSFLMVDFSSTDVQSNEKLNENQEEIEIHFLTNFDNDLVKVIYESVVLYSDTLTTNFSIEFAGYHKLGYDSLSRSSIIINDDTLLVGKLPKFKYYQVNYDPGKKEPIKIKGNNNPIYD